MIVECFTDLSDLSSGSVLHSAVGRPAFPVRLASGLFQAAYAAWKREHGVGAPCTLYDPCCGVGYSLTTLKLLHWRTIGALIGSDIDPEALRLARLNAGLLTRNGMRTRIDELARRAQSFGKQSHASAREAASRLLNRIEQFDVLADTAVSLFEADALDQAAMVAGLGECRADLVFADFPYGVQTRWGGCMSAGVAPPEVATLANLRLITRPGAVVIAVTRRAEPRLEASGFRTLRRIKGKGHRRASILLREV